MLCDCSVTLHAKCGQMQCHTNARQTPDKSCTKVKAIMVLPTSTPMPLFSPPRTRTTHSAHTPLTCLPWPTEPRPNHGMRLPTPSLPKGKHSHTVPIQRSLHKLRHAADLKKLGLHKWVMEGRDLMCGGAQMWLESGPPKGQPFPYGPADSFHSFTQVHLTSPHRLTEDSVAGECSMQDRVWCA